MAKEYWERPHTTVIGEPGSTTRGTLQGMINAVIVAGEAGCDAVKFQFLSNTVELLKQRNMPPTPEAKADYDLIRWKFSIEEGWREIRSMAKTWDLKLGISFYLPQDVHYLCNKLDLDIDFLKIASFEAEYAPLYDEMTCIEQRGPIFVSTGMLSQTEIFDLIERNAKEYPETVFRYLHCISAYPAKRKDLQLQVLRQKWCDGFSDHTKSTISGSLAVAVGARYIEIHYLADDMIVETPDAVVSLGSEHLEAYVTHIRFTEEMLGSCFGERKIVSEEELKNRGYKSYEHDGPFI